MAVTPKDVKNVALSGEFDDLKNSAIQIYLDMAVRCVDETVWGDKADDAIKLLTAHYLTLATREGASGPVTSEKVGDLQTNYGQSQSDSELASTSYGTMYLQMKKTLVTTPRVVQCPQ